MTGLDDALNTLIPIVIVLGGLYLFYTTLKEPLDKLFGLIGRAIKWIKRKITGEDAYDETFPPGIKELAWE